MHFQQLRDFYSELPPRIYRQLRLALDAKTSSDMFSRCCDFFELLTTHLADLCNSVYVDRPVESADEALETMLRSAQPRTFGRKLSSLREFYRIKTDLEQKLPELARVLHEKRLPPACIKLVKSFREIKNAREIFEIPPHTISKYLEAKGPPEELSKGKANLDDFLGTIIMFRNPGVAHRSEDSWFPQDPQFYALLNEILLPAIDELLGWKPLRAVLTRYEVVTIEPGDLRSSSSGSTLCAISRPHVLEGRLPLTPSRLRLAPHAHQARGALHRAPHQRKQ